MGFDVQCHPDYLLWFSGEFSCFYSTYCHFAIEEKEIFTEYHHSGPQMSRSQIVFALALIFKVRSDAKREKCCIFEVGFIC